MKQIFRKSLIDKMANPEQLDKAVCITSAMSWLVLVGIALVIVCTVMWTCFGSLPETLTVSGIIVSRNNCCAIYSDETGIVKELLVSEGSFSKGDIIARIESSDKKTSDIVAPADGVLSERLCEEGYQVYPGYEIARYTPSVNNELVALCYVPLTQAQSIKSGMEIIISPIGADEQQNGHMQGTVLSVSTHAVNVNNMAYVLGAENNLSELFISQGPVSSVLCSIKTDASSQNGFSWTSKDGCKLNVGSGTLLSVKIITDEYAPITKVFTFLNGENA